MITALLSRSRTRFSCSLSLEFQFQSMKFYYLLTYKLRYLGKVGRQYCVTKYLSSNSISRQAIQCSFGWCISVPSLLGWGCLGLATESTGMGLE